MPVVPAVGKLSQEDHKFEAILGFKQKPNQSMNE
jgi:hypothetical protein